MPLHPLTGLVPMRVFTYLLLLYTMAMFAVHLVSAWILRRQWISEIALLRFEATYYVMLVAYAVMVRTRGLVIAVAVLAVIHLSVWAVYEARRPAAAAPSTLVAVQVFDLGEALALAWIAWTLLA